MRRELRVPEVANFTSHVGDGEIVALGIGPRAEVCAVIGPRRLDRHVKPDAPVAHRVVVQTPSREVLVFAIEDLWDTFNVQPLKDGAIVHCIGYSEDTARCRIYDRQGHLRASLDLGPAIEDVQIDSDQTIWVSHFDEAVASGYPAVVAWTLRGQRTFEFQPVAGLEPPADCYALNVVSSSDVWFYYYNAFNLVYLKDRHMKSFWRTPVSGSHAFAVQRSFAMFAGEYDDRETYHLVSLSADRSPACAGRFKLATIDGRPIQASRVCGRGNELFVLQRDIVYRLGIDVAVSAATG